MHTEPPHPEALRHLAHCPASLLMGCTDVLRRLHCEYKNADEVNATYPAPPLPKLIGPFDLNIPN